MSERCFRLNSNLIYTLKITVSHAILILMCSGDTIFLHDTQNILHYGLLAQNVLVRFGTIKLFESLQN